VHPSATRAPLGKHVNDGGEIRGGRSHETRSP
jgi:hypothetical protein